MVDVGGIIAWLLYSFVLPVDYISALSISVIPKTGNRADIIPVHSARNLLKNFQPNCLSKLKCLRYLLFSEGASKALHAARESWSYEVCIRRDLGQ